MRIVKRKADRNQSVSIMRLVPAGPADKCECHPGMAEGACNEPQLAHVPKLFDADDHGFVSGLWLGAIGPEQAIPPGRLKPKLLLVSRAMTE